MLKLKLPGVQGQLMWFKRTTRPVAPIAQNWVSAKGQLNPNLVFTTCLRHKAQ
jgi:hypothetical protein